MCIVHFAGLFVFGSKTFPQPKTTVNNLTGEMTVYGADRETRQS